MARLLFQVDLYEGGFQLSTRTEKFEKLTELLEWWEGHKSIHQDYWQEEGLRVKTTIYDKYNYQIPELRYSK